MKILGTLIFASLFPFVVNAEVPKWYHNGDVKGEGMVVSIDIGQRLVVIDDQHMKLGNKIKVHSPSQEFAPLGKIQSGQIIGFDYEQNDQGKIEITEIWILDKDIISELDKAANKPSGTSGSSENNKASKAKGYRPPLRVSQ